MSINDQVAGWGSVAVCDARRYIRLKLSTRPISSKEFLKLWHRYSLWFLRSSESKEEEQP